MKHVFGLSTCMCAGKSEGGGPGGVRCAARRPRAPDRPETYLRLTIHMGGVECVICAYPRR